MFHIHTRDRYKRVPLVDDDVEFSSVFNLIIVDEFAFHNSQRFFCCFSSSESEWVRILSANNLNIWICRLDCNKYRQLKKYFAIATQNWIGKCLHSQLVRLLRRGWNNLICFNQNFPQRKIKFSLSAVLCRHNCDVIYKWKWTIVWWVT